MTIVEETGRLVQLHHRLFAHAVGIVTGHGRPHVKARERKSRVLEWLIDFYLSAISISHRLIRFNRPLPLISLDDQDRKKAIGTSTLSPCTIASLHFSFDPKTQLRRIPSASLNTSPDHWVATAASDSDEFGAAVYLFR